MTRKYCLVTGAAGGAAAGFAVVVGAYAVLTVSEYALDFVALGGDQHVPFVVEGDLAILKGLTRHAVDVDAVEKDAGGLGGGGNGEGRDKKQGDNIQWAH